ncbi:hypothetical protein AVEN_159593-1 [Araneus ventricosus]|uniref:Uncharacterized protein n=1 Tax=Araneus ventricosus TaxID=182803 RepID=A0A4Y2L7S0_ARAVE|nr:hypothetical protein AVEN_159593-1 [Araneus ventricosus]
MANSGKRKYVLVSMELRLDNDDDGYDIVENITSLVSHTDGMKAFEATLCYVEQQSLAFPIDVMLIKNGETMGASCRTSRLNKKSLLIF